MLRRPPSQCVGHFVETPLHTVIHEPPHSVGTAASVSTTSTLAGHTIVGPPHTSGGMGMLGSPHC